MPNKDYGRNVTRMSVSPKEESMSQQARSSLLTSGQNNDATSRTSLQNPCQLTGKLQLDPSKVTEYLKSLPREKLLEVLEMTESTNSSTNRQCSQGVSKASKISKPLNNSLRNKLTTLTTLREHAAVQLFPIVMLHRVTNMEAADLMDDLQYEAARDTVKAVDVLLAALERTK